jgi:hypothetical protein
MSSNANAKLDHLMHCELVDTWTDDNVTVIRLQVCINARRRRLRI